eukprot:g7599.t1
MDAAAIDSDVLLVGADSDVSLGADVSKVLEESWQKRRRGALLSGLCAGLTLGLLQYAKFPNWIGAAAAQVLTVALVCCAGAAISHRKCSVRAARAVGEYAAVAAACQMFQVLFHNEYCGWLFRCGCVWQWAGGWQDCNVHRRDDGPRCPWCTAKRSISWTTDCLVLGLMVLSWHEVRARRLGPWAAVGAPAAVFFAVGLLVALIFKLSVGYPYMITGPLHGLDNIDNRTGNQ